MSDAPQFQQIQLENWMNFGKVDVEFRERVFLVGPNASGKSNLLDVFRFLRDIASPGGGFEQAVQERGGVAAIRCLAARRNPDIRIAVTVTGVGAEPWAYELVFHQDNQRRPRVRSERVQRGATVLLQRPDDSDHADPERLTQTFLEQVNSNQAFRELAQFFASVRYLHLVPQLIREPERSSSRFGDPFGSDFLEQLASTSKRTRDARLRRIGDALRVAVPQLDQIELERDDRGAPHVRAKYRHWRPQGAWQSEQQFSDGTLRLLGLLWVIMEKHGPLLLEEPELSLHPEVVRMLPQVLARAQRKTGRQVLLSTHSVDMLRDSGIALEEVVLLQPHGEGTEVKAAVCLEDARALLDGGLTVGDIVMPHTQPADIRQLMLFDQA